MSGVSRKALQRMLMNSESIVSDLHSLFLGTSQLPCAGTTKLWKPKKAIWQNKYTNRVQVLAVRPVGTEINGQGKGM